MARPAAALVLGPEHPLHGLRRGALALGLAGAAAAAAGALASPEQFLRSYLVAYLFWVGVALGCLAILMIQHVTGGAWGAVIRRLLLRAMERCRPREGRGST